MRRTAAPGKSTSLAMMILVALMLICVPCRQAGAESPDSRAIQAADPMVKITTLPVKFDVTQALTGISKDVAQATGLPENMVTYYWQSFDHILCPGCAKAGITSPVFVDLYVPAFLKKDEIQKVMISLAEALEKHTPLKRRDVFIHTHVAEKEMMYIMGDVVTNWKQVGGPDE